MYYGINQARDHGYGAIAALTYWVFKCRDRGKSPAMGTKTWTYLESSIQNGAEISTCLEDYLQNLANKLVSHLRPQELTKIVNPVQRVYRVNQDGTEIQELKIDEPLVFVGWQDLITSVAPHGFSEWDLIELARTKAGIIQVLCRLRFEEDKALGADTPDEFIEVEVTNV